MSDHIDKGETGGFDDSQEELFDLDPESEEFDEIVSTSGQFSREEEPVANN
jgi:hypothetical protein